jgi:hypothetical protein
MEIRRFKIGMNAFRTSCQDVGDDAGLAEASESGMEDAGDHQDGGHDAGHGHDAAHDVGSPCYLGIALSITTMICHYVRQLHNGLSIKVDQTVTTPYRNRTIEHAYMHPWQK